MPNLEIAIFSYNRGAYLENCVTSVVRNMPGFPYLVYDDGSDESSTLSYLHRLGNQVRHMNLRAMIDTGVITATCNTLCLLAKLIIC